MNPNLRKVEEKTYREIYREVSSRFLQDELKCIEKNMLMLDLRHTLVKQEIMKRSANNE